ncbi:AAA family ATPase [Rhodovulum sp. YEN HP10]|uniref:AAA family ATPase n=1 Tax=Rhodovulum sp. HP10 TaxID=3387397 RepID=UPI0039E1C727
MARDFSDMEMQISAHRAEFPRERADRLPTAFVWRDPATIPPRPWVYGRHLIRKQVSVTVAPGGVGKSSLTICEALAMASGRELLGDWTAKGLKVWLYNLEDPRDEMERRIIAAMQHHNVRPEEIAGRLFVDTGRERALSTAIQTREGVQIIKPELAELAREIEAREIDVLVIDPFVSSHQASENDNGAIDLVAKEWARLADRCNCAIELVHHTRKTNGEEATTESGRGASALLAAARSGRVLNKMSDDLKAEAGVQGDPATYFAVTRDKANLAPVGDRVWRRMASVHLPNGDSVGVAEVWEWPETFDGVTVKDLLAVQQAIEGKHPRYSDQAGDDWAGVIVAEVLGLDATSDRKRIKKMIETWLRSGALVKGQKTGPIRKPVPTVEVGEWATE